MGFATLVENKDDNTGGHIRRSSAYAVLVAKNLRKNKNYKKIATINNSKNTFKDSSLSKNKTYYYKVRAYKTSNGKKVYGSYSSVKSTSLK